MRGGLGAGTKRSTTTDQAVSSRAPEHYELAPIDPQAGDVGTELPIDALARLLVPVVMSYDGHAFC